MASRRKGRSRTPCHCPGVLQGLTRRYQVVGSPSRSHHEQQQHACTHTPQGTALLAFWAATLLGEAPCSTLALTRGRFRPSVGQARLRWATTRGALLRSMQESLTYVRCQLPIRLPPSPRCYACGFCCCFCTNAFLMLLRFGASTASTWTHPPE
jgi:hypothetical protein